MKKPAYADFFVTRIGFKPMTYSLEGCRSIQLSYRALLLTTITSANDLPDLKSGRSIQLSFRVN